MSPRLVPGLELQSWEGEKKEISMESSSILIHWHCTWREWVGLLMFKVKM